MPKLHLGWNKDQVKELEPIPAGLYTAKIDTSESVVDESDGGNLFVTVTFVIEEPKEHAGRKLTQRYYLGENQVWKFNTMLKNLGLLPEKEGAFDFDTDTLHGLQCKIRVIQRTYEGTTYNDVRQVMPVQGTEEAAKAKKAINF